MHAIDRARRGRDDERVMSRHVDIHHCVQCDVLITMIYSGAMGDAR